MMKARGAKELAIRGYRVFPLIPFEKKPAVSGWPSAASKKGEEIDVMWAGREMNCGIACGQGLQVIDVDNVDRNTGEVRESGIEELALPETYTVLTPSGGRHLYFRVPTELKIGNTAKFLGPYIDTRGDGGYVVAPGSKLSMKVDETGKIVQTDGAYKVIVHMEPQPLPERIIARLLDHKAEPSPRALKRRDLEERDRTRRINLVKNWLMTVSPSVSEQGGHDQFFYAANCATWGAGLDVEDAIVALQEYNDRAEPPWSQEEIRHKVSTSGNGNPHGKPFEWLLEHETPPPRLTWVPSVRPPPPDSIFKIGGLIGEIAAWIDTRGATESPLLSVVAAISLVSVLMGRRYVVEGGSACNLYTVGMAPTGFGKEAGRKAVSLLLSRSKQINDLLGCEDFGSSQGIIAMLRKYPTRLCCLDEMGQILSAISSRNAAGHKAEITKELLKLFGSSSGVYTGSALATKTPDPIQQPYLTIYGTTTESTFWESITPDSVASGFLNRLLIFPCDGEKRVKAKFGSEPPSEGLIQRCEAIGSGAFLPGNMQSHQDASTPTAPLTIMRDAGGEAYFQDALHLAPSREDTTDKFDVAQLWVRAPEMCSRLAGIFAVNSNPQKPVIGADEMRLAVDIVRWSIGRMSALAAKHIATGENARIKDKIKDLMERNNGQCTAKELYMATRGVDKRKRNDLIEDMIEGREIFKERVDTGGRPTFRYSLLAKGED